MRFNLTKLTLRFIPLLALLASFYTLKAQSKPSLVKGIVENSTGKPLSGVSVVIKNNKTNFTAGTNTDSSGDFSFSQIPPGSSYSFTFSSVGYQDQTLSGYNIKDDITLSMVVKMVEVVSTLDEVVVVGYGTSKKSDLTGAVNSISTKDLKNQPTARVDEALQGRSPGLVVQNNSASPDGNVSIRIRGSNSINGANDPLVVIDGFIGGDISSVNPNDVASIEVLKDASSTAIYGSRGANGVILITTKKGVSGKVSVQYNAYLSFQSVAKKIELLNAAQYAETVDSNRAALGLSLPFTPDEIAAFKQEGGTDWQNEIYRKALQQNHEISVSGGGDNGSYYLSGNYVDNPGVIKGSAFRRYSVRSNVTTKISKKLSGGLNLYLSKSENHPIIIGGTNGNANQDIAPTSAALLFAPTFPVYNSDGSYTLPSSSYGPPAVKNPIGLATEPINNNLGNRLVLNTFLDYNITQGLTVKALFGVSSMDYENSFYTNTKPDDGLGVASAGITNSRSLLIQNTGQLNYKRTFAKVHKIDFTAVYERQTETFNTSFAGAKGFSSDAVTYNNLALGALPQIPTSGNTKKVIESYLGRLNYSFNDKYLLSIATRFDGASAFGKNHKWGYFPSGAIAWRIDREGFMQNVNQVSNLKLRTSYGVTGSQAVGPYSSLDQLNSNRPYPIDGINLASGVGLGIVGNPDLQWEKTAQFNIGLDIGMFANRIQLTVDYYNKKTSDLLLNVPLPLTSGYATKLENLGEVENKGFEFNVDGRALTGKFKWNTGINFATNRNTILSLGGQDNVPIGTTGFPNFGNTIFLIVGQPIGVLKGYIQDGIWGTAEAAKAESYGVVPGAPRYVDQNNDGKINAADIAIMGTTLPKYTYGWNNNFTYKQFDLNVLIQGVGGKKNYNLLRVRTERTSSDGDATDIRILNRWTPNNQNTNVPSFLGSNKYEQLQSSRWLEDGSYTRIKVISLGYNLPASVLSKLKIGSARIYASGVNLFTFTDYTGFDPEESTNVDVLGGIDIGSYPSQKTYTIGINLTFN